MRKSSRKTTPTTETVFTPVKWARYIEPRQRLEAETTRTRIELSCRKDGHPDWAGRARALCNAVQQAIERGHREAAWVLLLEARRTMVHLSSAAEREALGVSLMQEAAKVGTWRAAAMRRLLRSPRPCGAARLSEALLHLDSALTNRARKRRTRRIELLASTVTLLVALVAIVVVLLTGDTLSVDDVTFGNRKLMVLSVLFGVVGACVSTLQRVPARPWSDVPNERAALLASVVRPVSGAASGLLVLTASQAGLLGPNTSGVLIAAFAGGFTERYILRFVSEDDEKPKGDEKLGGAGTSPEPDWAAKEARNDAMPSRYFRANVGIVVVDHSGKVLVLQRADHPGAWQLPQGGIDEDEDAEAAAWRELWEETGLDRTHVELVGPLTDWVAYELPEDAQTSKTGLGQVQKWFEFRALSAQPTPTLDGGGEAPEFSAFSWTPMADVVDGAVEFRKPVYEQVARALADPARRPARDEPSGPPPGG